MLYVRVATLLLGGVFLVSAYLKALKPAETITALETLFGERDALTRLILYGLVFGEMILAGALLANVAPRRTLFITIGVLAVFTLWIVRFLAIGWTGGCGCSSWTPTLDPTLALWLSLGRNIFLIVLTAGGIAAARGASGQTAQDESLPAGADTNQTPLSTDQAQTSAFDV